MRDISFIDETIFPNLKQFGKGVPPTISYGHISSEDASEILPVAYVMQGPESDDDFVQIQVFPCHHPEEVTPMAIEMLSSEYSVMIPVSRNQMRSWGLKNERRISRMLRDLSVRWFEDNIPEDLISWDQFLRAGFGALVE